MSAADAKMQRMLEMRRDILAACERLSDESLAEVARYSRALLAENETPPPISRDVKNRP